MRDAQLLEPAGPGGQFRTVGTTEGQMIQTWQATTVAEWLNLRTW